MLIKKIFSVLAIFFIVSESTCAQIPAGTIMASGYYATISPLSDRAAAESCMDGIKTLYYGKNSPERVDGSPFLWDEFLPGEIGFSDSTRLIDVLLRYNIFMDQVQVIYNSDTLVVQPSYLVRYIRIDDRYFLFSLIYDRFTRKFGKGYFEILADGEYKLLKQYRRPLLYDSYATNYNSGGGTKRYYFGNETEFFYKKGEEAAVRLGRTERQIVNIFPPEKQDQVRLFISENNLQLRKQDDLIQLMQFGNR